MEKKSAFKTAFNELMGNTAAAAAVEIEQPAPAPADEPLMEEPAEESYTDNVVQLGKSVRPRAVITEDVVIDGSISAENDMVFAGNIKGNVRCDGKLIIQGKIEGDITAGEIEMSGAKIRGKTICRGMMNVDENSIIVGNIESDEIILSGKVNGNITVSGNADIRTTAFAIGDIEIGTVSVEHGATITGRLTTKTTENPSQMFSDLL